jgi:hypothetical protein
MKVKNLLNTFVFLGEAPQVIGDFDWDLSDPAVNASKEAFLMASPGTREIGEYNGLKLYRLKGQIFAIDPNKKVNQLVYLVKTEVVRISAINSLAVIQRAVWRDLGSTKTSGLPAYIFFKKWIPEFDTICTDGQQTFNGKTFWINRISEAFSRDLNIYVLYELSPRKLIKVLDMSEFDDLSASGDIWGLDPKYKNRKVIITSKILVPREDVPLDD